MGRLAAAVGIDRKDAFSLFDHFNPGQTLPQRAKRIQPSSQRLERLRDGVDLCRVMQVSQAVDLLWAHVHQLLDGID